jgi:hypothetical protein
VTKSETNGLLAGRWNWQRVATRTTEQVTRDSGDLVVIDGFASNASAVPFVDGRSWARQALDEIEAAILARASTGQTSASFNGRSVSWQSLAELYQIRSDLKAETAAEDDAENAGLGRQIRVRYGN